MEHLIFDGVEQLDADAPLYYLPPPQFEWTTGSWIDFISSFSTTIEFDYETDPDQSDEELDIDEELDVEVVKDQNGERKLIKLSQPYFLRLFVQEALIFGLLCEFGQILNIPYQCEDFLDEDPQVISTKYLPAFLDQIHSTSEDKSTEDDANLSRGQKCLEKASEVLWELCVLQNRSSTEVRDSIPEEFWLCTLIICEALHMALIRRYGEAANTETTLPPFVDDYYVERFADAGQCPSRGINLTAFPTASGTYFASSLIDERGKDHSKCETSICSAPFLKHEEKLPRHRSSEECDGSCKFLRIGDSLMEKMKSILDSGSFPLLKVSRRSDTGIYDLDVLDARQTARPFTAISHVWLHGLGNPVENGLYTCQLSYVLQNVARIPYANSIIWLDSLCVPLHRKYRQLAISRMRETYQSASATLALDEVLLKTGPNLMERGYRLLLSDWVQRLWPLQEALLAGERLFVAFADKVFNIHAFIKNLEELSEKPSVYAVIYGALCMSLKSSFLIDPQADRLLDVAANLHQRDTTKAEDEPICLATLMNIDPSELPMKATVADVLQKLETVPEDIIWAYGKRCTRPGFRWSPVSLLKHYSAQQRYTVHPEHANGKITERGLMIQKHGIRLPDTFWFDPLKPEERMARHYIVVNSDLQKLRIFFNPRPPQEAPEQLEPRQINDGYLILQSRGSVAENTCEALLVSQTKADDKIMYCRFEAIVQTADVEYFGRVDAIEDLEPSELRGDWVDFGYWCVD